MKPTALFLLLAPAVHAWTFVYDSPTKVADGKSNKGCTSISHSKNVKFSWDRGWSESCCIRLYSDSSCKSQVGLSCPDWSKKSSQALKSYKVTNC